MRGRAMFVRASYPWGRALAVVLGVPVVLVCAALVLAGCAGAGATNASAEVGSRSGERTLLIFAGAASKPPTEEIIELFETSTGAKVEVNFGGSGSMLAEMEIAEQGDIYFPGSSDWMDVAAERGHVDPSTVRRLVYLVSAINVQAGNPKGIESIEDLLRPDVRVVIANPETVCVGAYAVEILEKNLTPAEARQFREANLVNWADSCEKTANAISLKAADAVIGWGCFEDWDPQRIETVDFNPDELVRLAYIPIAVSSFARDPDLAQEFIEFISSEQSMEIFRKYGYFADVAEAQAYVGAEESLPLGGWYEVPDAWVVR